MKITIITILFFSIYPQLSKGESFLDKKIRNTNMTVKDYLIRQELIEKRYERFKKDYIKGTGVTFFSKVYHKKNDKGEEIFFAKTRGCNESVLKFKSDQSKKEFIKNFKTDKINIKYKTIGRSCDISEWKLNNYK